MSPAYPDCCLSGDDGVFAGPVIDQTMGWWAKEIGDEADAERKFAPAMMDRHEPANEPAA